MEITVFMALTIATLFTVLGSLSRSTRQTIILLALQAAAIGIVELMYCLVNLITGLQMKALIDFLAMFAEWFSCTVLNPLIIYWGMIKTENIVDQPTMGTSNATMLIIAITLSYSVFGGWFIFLLPKRLEVLPFIALMFTISALFMSSRSDPLKILAGLNMAENALYPLLAESPLNLIPLILTLMVFINVVGVFIIMEAYREYGALPISKWGWFD
ncbi:MAG: hypothetical protein QXQ02_00650 [Halobacteria archaeon]